MDYTIRLNSDRDLSTLAFFAHHNSLEYFCRKLELCNGQFRYYIDGIEYVISSAEVDWPVIAEVALRADALEVFNYIVENQGEQWTDQQWATWFTMVVQRHCYRILKVHYVNK